MERDLHPRSALLLRDRRARRIAEPALPTRLGPPSGLPAPEGAARRASCRHGDSRSPFFSCLKTLELRPPPEHSGSAPTRRNSFHPLADPLKHRSAVDAARPFRAVHRAGFPCSLVAPDFDGDPQPLSEGPGMFRITCRSMPLPIHYEKSARLPREQTVENAWKYC